MSLRHSSCVMAVGRFHPKEMASIKCYLGEAYARSQEIKCRTKRGITTFSAVGGAFGGRSPPLGEDTPSIRASTASNWR
jgi:hypothetical protein